MIDFIVMLQDWRVGEILIGVSGLLVLIDYLFPTDAPAHFGYICFAAAMFLLLPNLTLAQSAIAAVVIWAILAFVHQVWFRRFLENVPPDFDWEHAEKTADGE